MKQADRTSKEYGAVGGNTTLKRHGKKHFREIAKKRWESVKNNKSYAAESTKKTSKKDRTRS